MSRALRYTYIRWGTCITISFGLKIMKTPKKQTFRFRKSKKKEHLLNPVLCYRFPNLFKRIICSQAVFYKRTCEVVNIYSLIE